jgi:hypothetical protein
MAVPSVPIFGNPKRIASSVAVKASQGKIWALSLEGGTTASSMDIYNHASSASDDILIGITAPFTDTDASSQSTVFVSFLEVGGIDFSVGMYAEIAGTNAVGYIWWS